MYQGDHEEYEKVQTKLSEEYNALENPDETVVLRYSLSEENNLANTQYEPNTDISSRLRTASGSSADLQLAAGNGRLLQCSCQEEGHTVKPLSSFVNVAKPVNQPKRDTVSIPVEKQWKGTKQQEVNIELLRDGVLQFNTLTLNDKNGWKGTFENLDAVYENGNAYVYTVQEAGEEPKEKADHPQVLLEGVLYDVEIAGDAQNGFVVTNAETLHTPNNDIEDSEDSSHSSSQSSEDSKKDTSDSKSPTEDKSSTSSSSSKSTSQSSDSSQRDPKSSANASKNSVHTGVGNDVFDYVAAFGVSAAVLAFAVVAMKKH